MLGQATGRITKTQKCGVYFQTYMFVWGQSKVKKLKDLPPPIGYVTREDKFVALAHITVPQPGGSTALIHVEGSYGRAFSIIVHILQSNQEQVQGFGGGENEGCR